MSSSLSLRLIRNSITTESTGELLQQQQQQQQHVTIAAAAAASFPSHRFLFFLASLFCLYRRQRWYGGDRPWAGVIIFLCGEAGIVMYFRTA
jgi:hypothetical protein